MIEKRLLEIQSFSNELRASPLAAGYEYPWLSLDDELTPGRTLPIAGYGSLMNRYSAARTLSQEAVMNCSPIVVFNARRVYDYVMSFRSRKRFGLDMPESHCGVLNSYVTGDLHDYFNAVRIELSREQLSSFRDREFGYDLLPVLTLQWGELTGQRHPTPRISYILSCRNPTREGRQMVNPGVQPHPLYHRLCQAGCREISEDFLKMFHETTWVGSQTIHSPSVIP
ncbi:MAG TPA: hypothetical protein VNQ76_15370 [Planctomicrobium sp.]|nr:hypothetical protein [Planctomicrobium sp.]